MGIFEPQSARRWRDGGNVEWEEAQVDFYYLYENMLTYL